MTLLHNNFCMVCGVIRLSRADASGICHECSTAPAKGPTQLVLNLPPGMFPCSICKRKPAKISGGRCPACNVRYMRAYHEAPPMVQMGASKRRQAREANRVK